MSQGRCSNKNYRANPALTVFQGTLSLNGNAFTVNGSALAVGTYTLVQQASGNIAGSGPYSVTGTAIGAAGTTVAISVSGGNVILTLARATTTTLSPLTASTYGQSVTFTATVAPSPPGGTVQFYDNGVALGSPVTVSGGAASYTTSTLFAGSHPITAAYDGTTGYAASSTASTFDPAGDTSPQQRPGDHQRRDAPGQWRLAIEFHRHAGYTYLIQTTTSLNPPITWTTLGTHVADINGLFNFIDLGATNCNARYYRTAIQLT